MSITNDMIRDYLRGSPEAEWLFNSTPQFRYSVETTRAVLGDVERLMKAHGIPTDTARAIIHGVAYGVSGIDTPGRIAQATAAADVLADMATEASAPSIILGEN